MTDLLFDFHIPMVQAAVKPIQCALEEPGFIFGGFGISNGWLDNHNLVRREDALTECILKNLLV
jgi:hypothetical protein